MEPFQDVARQLLLLIPGSTRPVVWYISGSIVRTIRSVIEFRSITRSEGRESVIGIRPIARYKGWRSIIWSAARAVTGSRRRISGAPVDNLPLNVSFVFSIPAVVVMMVMVGWGSFNRQGVTWRLESVLPSHLLRSSAPISANVFGQANKAGHVFL